MSKRYIEVLPDIEILPFDANGKSEIVSHHDFFKGMLMDNRLRTQFNLSLRDIVALERLFYGGKGRNEKRHPVAHILEIDEEKWRPLDIVCTNCLFINSQWEGTQLLPFADAIKEAKTKDPRETDAERPEQAR